MIDKSYLKKSRKKNNRRLINNQTEVTFFGKSFLKILNSKEC